MRERRAHSLPAWTPLLAWIGVLAAGAASGCTEEALTGVDPGTAPGEAAETVQVELPASDLALWRDTTFVGYALPLTSDVRLVAGTPELRSRVLGRFSTLPDSVFIEEERLPIETFADGRVRLVVDSADSRILEVGARLELWTLSRPFDAREADWTTAEEGVPWTSPGGDLDRLLGALEVGPPDLTADTVFLPLDVDTDSLLRAWRDVDGEPGFALIAATGEAVVTLDQVALSFDVKPVGRDTLINTLRAPAPSTFIFEPQTPPPGVALRLGGLPAARAYLRFELPEAVGSIELRGARINRATLLLTSTGAPPEPFTTSDTLSASVFSLLSDPFSFGPKTPVGGNIGNSVQIVPEEMAGGGVLELPVTALVQFWAGASPDSVTALDLGVRLLPEGSGLAFWEFFDADDPADAPRLRILLTPTTQFDLP